MALFNKLPEGIERLPIKKWQNKHKNFEQRLTENASFKLRPPASCRTQQSKYRAATANFQWLIQYGIDHKVPLRAMGSGWSFSKVGVSDGGIIDTKALYTSFNIGERYVSNHYREIGKTAEDLFFVQCGNSIHRINTLLEKMRKTKRSLKASGASNGQTIAGALSTGTHGAAFGVGAVQDFVVGLHLIVGPDRHVWLERSSYPVASAAFVDWLGAELICDDMLFNAALVSFGSFGFINGVMIETEPLYLLESHRWRLPFNEALQSAMQSLDFSKLELPHPAYSIDRQLYHFEVVVNPHCFKKDNLKKGVYVKTIYKSKYRDDYPPKKPNKKGLTYGDDTLGLIQKVVDMFRGLPIKVVPGLVNTLFPLAFGNQARKGPSWGTLRETFPRTTLRGKAASVAIGVSIENSGAVLEELLRLNKKKPFPGAFGCRFVKGSQALLGFTRFEQTCVVELDGVDSKANRDFCKRIWNRLEERQIPFTLHWGKINFYVSPERVRRMYGDERVDQWLSSRKQLLDKDSRKVFDNDFLRRCGLDSALHA